MTSTGGLAHAPSAEATSSWVTDALERLRAEPETATPLVPFTARALEGIALDLKDESQHPTGSLKHRLARSLFVDALRRGVLGPTTVVVEASSGSTAVSEAYFARLIGVPFVAVLPASTSPEKIALIEREGGRVERVTDAAQVVPVARRLAQERGGHFMDQFENAASATDWRNRSIAEELFGQLDEAHGQSPRWVVVGAGTGGTSTCLARFARFHGLPTGIAVVDPEGSAFLEGWRRRDRTVTTLTPSRIEGIGRMRVEASFLPDLVDDMIAVPDAASVAAMRWASELLGRRVGPSTGSNIWGALVLAGRMRRSGETGRLASLICDDGDRYASTYYDDRWLQAVGVDIRPALERLRRAESRTR